MGRQFRQLDGPFRRLHDLLHGQRLHYFASHIHYEFADKAQRHPVGAEWKDANGNLRYAAYYQYAFDSHANWVRREILIVSPEHPDRTPYETDTRTITYRNP